MSEIRRDLDDQGKPILKYGATLELLAKSLLHQSDRNCIIFLGAGASFDDSKPSLPTGSQLSKNLAENMGLEWHEYVPLSTIAFYYEFFSDRVALNTFIEQQIGNPDISPSSTIESLAKIIKILEEKSQHPFLITTNYDRQLETAYRQLLNKELNVIIYKGGWDPADKGAKLHEGIDRDPDYWLPGSETYLYKMHGCISEPDGQNLVITEEDYINFLTNAFSGSSDKRLLHDVRGKIADRKTTILFVGYSLADWNFRVIYKTTAEESKRGGINSFAVQYNPLDRQATSLESTRWQATVDFWGKKNVDIVNVNGAFFMDDLLQAVRDAG